MLGLIDQVGSTTTDTTVRRRPFRCSGPCRMARSAPLASPKSSAPSGATWFSGQMLPKPAQSLSSDQVGLEIRRAAHPGRGRSWGVKPLILRTATPFWAPASPRVYSIRWLEHPTRLSVNAPPWIHKEHAMKSRRLVGVRVLVSLSIVGMVVSLSMGEGDVASWEAANPIKPIPDPPLRTGAINYPPIKLTDFEDPPTPERVRLGRWLFFDKRLSADNTISCASCHQPKHGFSEPTPVSTGIGGKKGGRKAPSFLNQAWTTLPHFFWDGRAASLEEQAGGPMINPIEMGNKNHDVVVAKLAKIRGYAKYFKEAFGTEEVTIERVTKAIADYERTRMSGNSPWDKWRAGDQNAVSDDVKKGDALFHGNAFCNNCHKGPNFTDGDFHNLGVGWDADKKKFADEGRFVVTKKEKDKGAFKTPSLRDVSKRAPYMHDGSIKTLRETVELYSKGGIENPYLDKKIDRRFAERLDLSKEQINQLVKFMEALDGEGYQDTEPKAFPQ